MRVTRSLGKGGHRPEAPPDFAPLHPGYVSNIELEEHHVAVLDDVLLALVARLARLLRADLAATCDEIVVGNCLRADEAFLEIRVDHARGLRRLHAFSHGPGSRLLRPDGEE